MVIKAQKKPIIIEAIEYTGKNSMEVMSFSKAREIEDDFLTSELVIKTLEGDMKVSVGDYVIKGMKGEFYPCKPDIFLESYEIIK